MSDFPPHTYDQWKEAAIALLKGKPFEKLLITPTYEGFKLEPLFTLEHAQALPHWPGPLPGLQSRLRGTLAEGYKGRGWGISQELTSATPSQLRRVALHELENGQNELNIWLDAPTRTGLAPDDPAAESVGVCGCSIATLHDINTLFDGIHLPYISVYWRAGAAPLALASLFLASVEDRGGQHAELRGCIECDPLAYLVEKGSLPYPMAEAYDAMAALTQFARERAPQLQTVAVQGHAYHHGGGASHQEMAAVLATGVAYLRALQERGLKPAQVAPHVRLSLSIGPNTFIEIAKFRAMRALWARVMEAFGAPPEHQGVHLHVRTGLFNKTLHDPYVNMLRTTTEAFSAVVGGVDSLCIGAFDEIIREPDDFSRRIARNTHHILAEECDLTEVIDPAGGSWGIEWLTHQMAERAWGAFQEIEQAGGIERALSEGFVQSRIKETLAAQRKNIQRRKDVIVGTNTYPNATEQPLPGRRVDYRAIRQERLAAVRNHHEAHDGNAKPELLRALREHGAGAGAERVRAAMAAARAGATLQELQQALHSSGQSGPRIEMIPLHRAAEDYEALRRKAGDIAARTGKAPTILQANLGPSRRYRARADWTAAFFQVAGFRVLSDDDFAGPEAAAAAAEQHHAPIVVITSDDETYAEHVPALAKALKERHPAPQVIVAGMPGDHEAAWREAGVDDFVHVRVNNHAFNKTLLERF